MVDASMEAVARSGVGQRWKTTPSSVLTALLTLMVALAGAMAFSIVTHGFKALTSEAARRAVVLASPVVVPELIGTDQTGQVRSILADPGHAGPIPRVTIVEFIYTRCETLCIALGSSFEQLQAMIRERHLEGRVRLLTVSFDPAYDTTVTLAHYAQRMRADPDIWTFISPARPEQLAIVLATFGVVVVPVAPGQFQHNAAFHLVDARGQLARIVDADNPRRALEQAVSMGQLRGPMT